MADVLLVYAKTDPSKGQHGISAFIVEKNFPGFSVAQKLNKMGWRGSPTGELVFEDCRVPAGNLVGAENDGVGIVMSGLDIERAIACFYSLGMSHHGLQVLYALMNRKSDWVCERAASVHQVTSVWVTPSGHVWVGGWRGGIAKRIPSRSAFH